MYGSFAFSLILGVPDHLRMHRTVLPAVVLELRPHPHLILQLLQERHHLLHLRAEFEALLRVHLLPPSPQRLPLPLLNRLLSQLCLLPPSSPRQPSSTLSPPSLRSQPRLLSLLSLLSPCRLLAPP